MSLEYREFTPSGPVAEYVECYWTLEGEVAPGAEPERVVPDGRPELVWNLADPILRHGAGSPPRRQASALLVGQITRPILLEPTGRIDLVGARFLTSGLRAFLGGVPVHELTDVDVPIDEILGMRLRTFRDEAGAIGAGEARVRLLEARLTGDLRHASPADPRVAAAVGVIGARAGRVRVDDLAESVCLSGRQLERLFLAEVGISPKKLARISRLQHLVSLLRTPRRRSWANLALECGYYDQAHLIRDVREFTGGPPGALLGGGEPSMMEVFLADGAAGG
jgi:AraC-like DNA-binding protein